MRDDERLPAAPGSRHHVTIYIALADDVRLTESHLYLLLTVYVLPYYHTTIILKYYYHEE